MKRTKWIVCVAGLAALGTAGALSAEASAPAFGVDAMSSEVINTWDMQPSTHLAQWSLVVPSGHRYFAATGSMFAGVHVPQGAKITTIAIDACDNSIEGGVTFSLFRSTSAETTILATVTTGTPDTPGCTLLGADLATPETVNTDAYRYWVGGGNETGDGQTTVGAVRIYYQLQVSPAPGSPTFNDVPASDPAFQYVEALAASGITAGCGGGNYCPDAPLTRRQMAVFLAKALGLHWPNLAFF
jgi:hypothetical protein